MSKNIFSVLMMEGSDQGCVDCVWDERDESEKEDKDQQSV